MCRWDDGSSMVSVGGSLRCHTRTALSGAADEYVYTIMGAVVWLVRPGVVLWWCGGVESAWGH
jgi:hypothetical protein